MGHIQGCHQPLIIIHRLVHFEGAETGQSVKGDATHRAILWLPNTSSSVEVSESRKAFSDLAQAFGIGPTNTIEVRDIGKFKKLFGIPDTMACTIL